MTKAEFLRLARTGSVGSHIVLMPETCIGTRDETRCQATTWGPSHEKMYQQ